MADLTLTSFLALDVVSFLLAGAVQEDEDLGLRPVATSL